MNQHGLVSESVASALSLELISYFVGRHTNREKNETQECAENEILLNALKDLEGLGLLVGLRLAERLLYREASFGMPSPLDVARFVGQQVWKTAFGKKVDRMRHMDNIYFCLIDNNFRWLQGFPKIKTERIVSTLVVYPPGYSEEPISSDEITTSQKEKISNSEIHKNILVYAVGILRGIVQVMYPSGSVRIYASLNKENETHFVLDFRPLNA